MPVDVPASRVRLLGQGHSAEAYRLRDFLQRSVVAFHWVELRTDEDCQHNLGLPGLASVRLPVVELPDGARLFSPSPRELAERLGWVTQPRLREYDLSIYGAGRPASRRWSTRPREGCAPSWSSATQWAGRPGRVR